MGALLALSSRLFAVASSRSHGTFPLSCRAGPGPGDIPSSVGTDPAQGGGEHRSVLAGVLMDCCEMWQQIDRNPSPRWGQQRVALPSCLRKSFSQHSAASPGLTRVSPHRYWRHKELQLRQSLLEVKDNSSHELILTNTRTSLILQRLQRYCSNWNLGMS